MPNARAVFLLGVGLFAGSAAAAELFRGRVVDEASGRPIAGAFVTAGSTVVRTARDGAFAIDAAAETLGVRAIGYGRRDFAAGARPGSGTRLTLSRIKPRALYLSLPDLDDAAREQLLSLQHTTRINALVVPLKARDGLPLVEEAARLLPALRARGFYTIAILPAFKDSFLAAARPELAMRARGGELLRDNDGEAWIDPRLRAAWDYNLDLAREAARLGFDEIQFDYVRFPTVLEAPEETQAARRGAIAGFLAEAREALKPFNVFLSADVYGYASWDRGDTNIGQKLEEIAAHVDYVCLMLYPSSFKRGLPGAPYPVEQADRVVELSLERARERTGLAPARFRPWLQAFRDYNFDRRHFGRAEIHAQVRAAERFGASGWMLFHQRGVYTPDELPRPALRLVQAR